MAKNLSYLLQEQILLTLIYLRHSPTFQLLGIQLGVSETTANDIFHYWLPIISEALPPTLIEQVKKCEGDYEWLQELLSELQLIVDTERTSQRETWRLPRAKTVLFGEEEKSYPEKSIYCLAKWKGYRRYSPRSTRI